MLKTNELNKTDQLLEDLTEYVLNQEITSQEAFETARYVLLDTLGCGILALNYPECTKLMGPILYQARLFQMDRGYQVRLMYWIQ